MFTIFLPALCHTRRPMRLSLLALLALSSVTRSATLGHAPEGQGPRVTVDRVFGVPTFVVNDEAFMSPCFETYVPTEHYFRQFAEAGTKLFCFNANVTACDYGHSKPTHLESGEWDYSGFDERVATVLAAQPDAMIMPRVNLGTPVWWLEAHPEEMEVLDHGSIFYKDPNTNPTIPKGRAFPSLASKAWREYQANALRKFFQHVQNSDYAEHMFGYILTGLDTEEWYHWSSGSNQLAGYSQHTQAAFRDWLTAKYETDEQLQQAWRDDSVTLATATVPSRKHRLGVAGQRFRSVETDVPVIDFYVFYNELIPRTIDFFAEVARTCVGDEKALGAFYGYMYEFRGDPEYGHNALERFNASSYLDFIYVTASYGNRQPGTGGDYSRAPGYSVQLNGKLWYNDNDVVSFLAPEVLRKAGWKETGDWTTSIEHHLEVLGYSPTTEGTKWMYRRSMGFALCNGAYPSFFDLHGGYYDHPELMAEVAQLNRLASASAGRDRSKDAEILVVADEDSNAYTGFASASRDGAMSQSPPIFLKLGAPQHQILLCDLPKVDLARYKLVIFLNCYNVESSERDWINPHLKRDDKTLVWCYAPGLFNGPNRPDDGMSNLTGIEVDPTEMEPESSGMANLRPSASTHQLAQAIAKRLDDSRTPSGAKDGEDEPQRSSGLPFHVIDDSATPLAVDAGTGLVTLAQKAHNDWTSIYSSTALLPPDVWREIAAAAGVHIFNDANDTLYVNRSYLCVHANGDGERTIKLPVLADVRDAFATDRSWHAVDSVTLPMVNGETVLLEWRSLEESATP